MKQSKGLQYVLFVLVAVIWGAIIYQVWQYLKPEDDGVDYTSRHYAPQLNEVARDTYSLSLAYADPFTGKLTKPTARTSSESSRGRARSTSMNQGSEVLEEVTSIPIPPPEVEYVGYSINNSQVTRVRLRINGSSMTFRLHEQKEGLFLQSMSRDSVVLDRAGERFVFYRKR